MARLICDPAGYSSIATQASTRKSGAVRHAINPQPVLLAVDKYPRNSPSVGSRYQAALYIGSPLGALPILSLSPDDADCRLAGPALAPSRIRTPIFGVAGADIGGAVDGKGGVGMGGSGVCVGIGGTGDIGMSGCGETSGVSRGCCWLGAGSGWLSFALSWAAGLAEMLTTLIGLLDFSAGRSGPKLINKNSIKAVIVSASPMAPARCRAPMPYWRADLWVRESRYWTKLNGNILCWRCPRLHAPDAVGDGIKRVHRLGKSAAQHPLSRICTGHVAPYTCLRFHIMDHRQPILLISTFLLGR